MILGILGTGMIVQDLMKIYDGLGVEKTYLLGVPALKEQAEEMAEKHGFAGIFYDYDEMLESEVDTVYVALPNHLHYAFSKKALQKGKHVICEKPFTSNAKEAKDLIDLAREKKLMLFEAMNIHYLPAYISLQEDIKKLGDIKICSFNYSQYSSRYNAFKEGNILPAFDYHKSGGALMDINVYNIHSIVGLFGEPKDHAYMANIENNIDTSGIMTLDYGTFKAIAIGAKDCKSPVMNTIQGDQAAIVSYMPMNTFKEYTILYNDGTSETKSFGDDHRSIYEWKEFIRMVDTGAFEEMDRKLDLTYTISKTLEKGRKTAGIVFDADK